MRSGLVDTSTAVTAPGCKAQIGSTTLPDAPFAARAWRADGLQHWQHAPAFGHCSLTKVSGRDTWAFAQSALGIATSASRSLSGRVIRKAYISVAMTCCLRHGRC